HARAVPRRVLLVRVAHLFGGRARRGGRPSAAAGRLRALVAHHAAPPRADAARRGSWRGSPVFTAAPRVEASSAALARSRGTGGAPVGSGGAPAAAEGC